MNMNTTAISHNDYEVTEQAETDGLVQNIKNGSSGRPRCLILCFVDHASLYNLVNKANLVHNFS
jgi:hypothetical protein